MFTSCETTWRLLLLPPCCSVLPPHAGRRTPLLRALPEIPSRRPSINCQFTHKSG